MEDLFPLPQYDVNSAAWFYLSLLLIVAVFFRFTRLWSLRNFDLALLVGFSPALLVLGDRPAVANSWLFALSGVLLLRLLCDGWFRRRPRTEQNLNPAGMAFLGCCALVFLIARVVTLPLPYSTLKAIERSEHMRQRTDASAEKAEAGPTSTILAAHVGALSDAVSSTEAAGNNMPVVAARILAILAHLAMVAGLLVLGQRVFDDAQLGLAMALLYLLLPCTIYQAGEVIHVLPAALVLWAFISWRRPVVAGVLTGLACGALFFPVFLVPLWVSFYGRRRGFRFLAALLAVGAGLLGSLVLTSEDPSSFSRQTFGAIDWSVLWFRSESAPARGFWSVHDTAYRMPVFAAYAVLLIGLTVWPRRKNLEHLLAASTALVVGTQFWYPQQGGVYLLWYLPLTLGVMFRPRLALLTAARPEQDDRPRTAPPAGRNLVDAGSSTALFR